ncbi:Spo0E family sporulation regulatory protein-aspartic acid phosphatase [Paenibacillus gansuensis]|uniref:Spo0E family sporulation regulatory protein-aspartic acid phosphatase n=1 Tax=Paenibacillus gansuensis TaxID=306542 RepID=A0ABW5PA02_9BACL
MERDLCLIINFLREQMVSKANERGSFVDEQVVELSQQLDFFIYQFQLMKSKKRNQFMFGFYALVSAGNKSVSAVS